MKEQLINSSHVSEPTLSIPETTSAPESKSKLSSGISKAAVKILSDNPSVIDIVKKLHVEDEYKKRSQGPGSLDSKLRCFDLSLAEGHRRESSGSIPRTTILGCEEVRPEDMSCCDEDILDNCCEIWAQRYKCGSPCNCCCLGFIVGHMVMAAQQAYKSKYMPEPSVAELVEKYYLDPKVQNTINTVLMAEFQTYGLSPPKQSPEVEGPARMEMQ